MSGRLDGKVCVIAGVAGAIGQATAAVFEREGARVVGVDLREHATGRLSLQADLADERVVADMYSRVYEELDHVDVLFNNAGIAPTEDRSVLDTSLEAWEQVQAVNLRSVFLCCKHGIPHLLAAGGGSVINTASFVALMGSATPQIAYTASKGGVVALTRELGVEFARQGVRVNAAVSRSGSDTDAPQAVRHRFRGALRPRRRNRGAALFLASDESSYVNATAFLVDGGISAAYTTPV